ncbi:hypothetical protein M758_1G133600 [Ceratodon purpureus]|nr:hypothetical protein M758_1G133600 [Ceratodon purpureus]
MQRRYESLQLHDAIGRRSDYIEACRELRCILRAAYVYAPKLFQALLNEDVIHAFRTLPRMENSRQLEAAKLLLLTVEDLFPKQRVASAVHEYQTAIAAWHRHYENPEPLPECIQLSGDTLLHVFGYLDARSLATASAVCREWNVAATDDTLWHNQYLYLFGTQNPSAHHMTVAGFHEAIRKPDQDDHQEQVSKKPPDSADFVQCGPRRQLWRKAFNLASKDRPSHLFTSDRAYCPVCNMVVWLVEPPWISTKGRCVARNQILEHHSPRPMSVSQVCIQSFIALYVSMFV